MADLDTVRLLTGLTVGEIADEQITALLDLHGQDVKLAAAEALDIVASQLISVSSDDISLDGTKRASALTARAAQLRAQAAADGFTFDVVDTMWPRPELTEPESGW